MKLAYREAAPKMAKPACSLYVPLWLMMAAAHRVQFPGVSSQVLQQ